MKDIEDRWLDCFGINSGFNVTQRFRHITGVKQYIGFLHLMGYQLGAITCAENQKIYLVLVFYVCWRSNRKCYGDHANPVHGILIVSDLNAD